MEPDTKSDMLAKPGSPHMEEDAELAQNSARPVRQLEAPELVRNLTTDERFALEKRLVRKIDFRLLPMIILSELWRSTNQ